MNPPPPWMRFDVAAFWLGDEVEMMTFEEVGLLWYLLGREWLNGPLPDDDNLLKRLVRSRVKDWEACWSVVRRCFEKTSDGKLVCGWIEAQRAEAEGRRRERMESGSRGGKSRHRKPREGSESAQSAAKVSFSRQRPEPEQSSTQSEAEHERSSSSPQARTNVRTDARTNKTDGAASPAPPPATSKSSESNAHKEFKAFWCDAFLGAKGCKYGFSGAKDGKLINEILAKAGGDLELAKACATALLTDKYFFDKGVDLGRLVSQWNRLASSRSTGAQKSSGPTALGYEYFVPPDPEAPL